MCYPGYYVTKKNETFVSDNCLPCKKYCRKCVSADSCEECLEGFDQFNGNCLRPVINCILMGEDGNCKVCKSYFDLQSDGSCLYNNFTANTTNLATLACNHGLLWQNYMCFYC